ncbi:putative colanic acid biosynthesis UDP-glucose lipid carrier transferase [Mariprofundus micogutta]|uniref:Putative colanic acid biosynthesis UDP-glucose lipid carrier transferase n=1 Tax=Mariprofundus micogutta TaxID=1921010 RepID=A0A1L8CRB3_9PROT|nr:sugar transferase [Mariprofundus micogutta]GAV21443.1 putative colanic acid biosynthesis UDP-glucose lipid carrier transferase [Mariprofundus micogutta]
MSLDSKAFGNGTLGRDRSQRMVRASNPVSLKMQLLLDILLVETVLFLFVWLKGITDFELYYYPATIAPMLMWLIYSNSGVYRRFSGNIGRALNVLWAWTKVMGILIAWAFVTKDSHDFSRQVIISWFIAAAILQMAAHVATNYFIRSYIKNHRQSIPSIMIGNSELGGYLAEHINSNPWTAHKIVGVIAVADDDVDWHAKGLPRLGGLADLRGMVEKYGIRRVYFALPMQTSHHIREMQLQLLDLNVDIIWAPDIFGLHMVSPSVKEVACVPLYYLSESPMVEGARLSKLMLDKILSVLALIMLSPLMIGAAIAVKISSPGPVFFRQERHGLDGKIIHVLKFLSMKLHEEKEGQITQAQKGDNRITRVGAFMRKTSIDELPQIFNVLKGEMSLVGPRPHAVAHNEFYADKVHATCPATVSFLV